MLRIFMALAVLLFAALPVRAEGVSPADRSTFESIITRQLQAFSADNGADAFEFAAPIIKNTFGTPENFMAMVMKGYRPVYRNNGYKFGDAEDTQMGPAQHVFITGVDGKQYEAVYTMQQQPDGSWKISGCYLREVPGVGA